MRILFVLIVLLIPVFTYAEPCQDIEYAELKDMSQVSFGKKLCNVLEEIKEKQNIWKKENTVRAWQDMDSCYDLSKKMERVYRERFKNETPLCFKKNTKK